MYYCTGQTAVRAVEVGEIVSTTRLRTTHITGGEVTGFRDQKGELVCLSHGGALLMTTHVGEMIGNGALVLASAGIGTEIECWVQDENTSNVKDMGRRVDTDMKFELPLLGLGWEFMVVELRGADKATTSRAERMPAPTDIERPMAPRMHELVTAGLALAIILPILAVGLLPKSIFF